MTSKSFSQIDAICDAFETAWKNGTPPDIKAYVDSASAELRPMLDVELVALDTEYRTRHSVEVPTAVHYAELLGVPVELLLNGETLASPRLQTPNARLSDTDFAIDVSGRDELLLPATGFGFPRKDATGLPVIRGYRILSRVGQGGMGVVYKAIQEQANRVVALKTIHAPLLADHEQIQRFKREASAAARLSHEHIVPIHEVGESDGIHFFSMMYVDGMDLETRLRNEPLSCRDAASVCLRIAEALAHAHSLGVIHRDVKPYNILVDHSLSPKLADFGVARLNDGDGSITSTGQILGTAAYMAPEQADTASSEIQATVDIYSLGATLYRCLTGRPPFHAASVAEILRQVHADEPIQPSVLNKEVDADLETICLRCLEKNPNRRFPTAQDLADELRRYLNHEPIRSRKIEKLERLHRWTMRHKSAAASLVLGLALLMFVSAGIPLLLLQSSELEVAKLYRQQSVESLRQVTEAQRQSEEKRQQAELLAKANEARAANQEYYASLMKVREQRFRPDRKVGWTWDAADMLKKAAVLNADGRDATELRTLLAEVLLTPDIRPIGSISGNSDIAALAVSHDGNFIAVGDQFGNPLQIRVFRVIYNANGNPHDSAAVRFEQHCVCETDVTHDLQSAEENERLGRELDVLREGIRSLTFSSNGQHIVAGTRNGNIKIWQINTPEPVKLFDQRFKERDLKRLSYSPNGELLAVVSGVPDLVRVFSFNSTGLEQQSSYYGHDAAWIRDDVLAITQDDRFIRYISMTGSRDTPFFNAEPSEKLTRLDVVRHGSESCLVLNSRPPVLVDGSTSDVLLTLEASQGHQARSSRLYFSPSGTMIFSHALPAHLDVWETHSGKSIVCLPFAGDERPELCRGSKDDVFFLGSHKSLIAYQVRGVLRQPEPRLAFPSSKDNGEAQLASVTSMGRQEIKRFAFDEEKQRFALLERAEVIPSGILPNRFRVHVSVEETQKEPKTANWTCLNLAPMNADFTTERDDIAFSPHHEHVFFTAPVPGQLVRASADGFQFLSGIDVDVEEIAVEKVCSKDIFWPSRRLNNSADVSGHHVGVVMNFSRPLKPNERIELEVESSDARTGNHQITNTDVPYRGWYLFILPGVDSTPLSESPLIRAHLDGGELSFQLPGEANSSLAEFVTAGGVVLIPWIHMHRGRSTHPWPLRIGPFLPRRDGGLDAVIESWTLRQWDNLAEPATSSSWRDEKNSEEDIRGIVPTPWGTFLGTDSGLVALVDAKGIETLIEPAHTQNGPFDSRDGVAAVDFAQNTSLAIAGTLRGQVKVYDLKKPGGPAFLFDAHEREITALSIDDDARLIATAAGDGSLRIWNVLDQRASLHFEYTGRSNRISQLKLIDNGRKLLILRDGDTGIVQLDLERFDAVFRDYRMLD